MSTFVVSGSTTDFTQDFEDLVISYIFNKWSISVPPKGTVMKPDVEVEPDKVHFKAGFPDYFIPYECCVVQTTTRLLESFGGGKFLFTTSLDVMLRMKRLDRDAVATDPQLENMENEIGRIVEHYKPNEIPGIKDMLFDPTTVSRVYNATDTWAKSDWRSIFRISVFYQKDNLI
jgi:hypothetical protein